MGSEVGERLPSVSGDLDLGPTRLEDAREREHVAYVVFDDEHPSSLEDRVAIASFPQHALAMAQMDAAGPIFSFEVDGGRTQAHALLDALALIDISNNIGDSRSLMTHPASTTHASVAEDKRVEMGIGEGLLRLNVGLEDPQDLIEDLDQALTAAGL